MMYYNLYFTIPYLDISTFKQKNAQLTINNVVQSNLGNILRFAYYGIIEFTDDKHFTYNIHPVEKFNRLKVNCIIFDVIHNEFKKYFDKVIIYNENRSTNPVFGYVLYNSSTGKCIHVFNIDYLYDELCMKIKRSFNNLKYSYIYTFYSDKYDSGKNKTNYGSLSDYNRMKQKFDIVKKQLII